MVGAVAGQWERELLYLGFELKSPQKGAGMGGRLATWAQWVKRGGPNRWRGCPNHSRGNLRTGLRRPMGRQIGAGAHPGAGSSAPSGPQGWGGARPTSGGPGRSGGLAALGAGRGAERGAAVGKRQRAPAARAGSRDGGSQVAPRGRARRRGLWPAAPHAAVSIRDRCTCRRASPRQPQPALSAPPTRALPAAAVGGGGPPSSAEPHEQ